MPQFRGTIVAFDDSTYRATVRLDGSAAQVLAGVHVNRLAAASVTAGRKCLVDTGDHANIEDTVVLAVWEQGAAEAAGGQMKVKNGGTYTLPGTGVYTVTSGSSADAYGSWAQFRAASGNALYIVGVSFRAIGQPGYAGFDIGLGAAASEVSIGEFPIPMQASDSSWGVFIPLVAWIPVPASTRIAVRAYDNETATNGHQITLHVVDQADVEPL